MPIKIIGKSILGERGFCQMPSKMEKEFYSQLQKIIKNIPVSTIDHEFCITSMTDFEEIKQTNGEYYPKINKIHSDIINLFHPYIIYTYCTKRENSLRPGSDFIVWDKSQKVVGLTFSREAPILAFESSNGKKALGVILRPSLMKYGDYLFSTMKKTLGGNITVTLVTCNHFEYVEGSIPSVVKNLSLKHNMDCVVCYDSEKEPECYHRDEEGNHIVALW